MECPADLRAHALSAHADALTSRLQQGSTRREIGGLVERVAFSQYVPRWEAKAVPPGIYRPTRRRSLPKVLCNVKEKELEATLSEQRRGLCAVCHSDTRMPCSLVRATLLSV
jgi:hypothetical protein